MSLPSLRLLRRFVLVVTLLSVLSGVSMIFVPPGALCLSCKAVFYKNTPRLTLRQGLVWRNANVKFGGLSGLKVTQKGKHLITLSDQGTLFEADVSRDPKRGAITGLSISIADALLDRRGNPLSPFRADAEDLAQNAQGDIFVSFEGLARVARYPSTSDDSQKGRIAKDMNVWDRFETRFGNTAFEALVSLPNGDLLVIAEAAIPNIDTGPGAPAFAYRDGEWTKAFDIPDPAGFAVSSADIGPDGRLWLLERRVSVTGFVTRIRRFTLQEKDGQLSLGDNETLLNAYLGPRDNFEGLSVWLDERGCTIATLITDDGFSRWQRTAVTEFILGEPQPTAC